MFSLLPVEEGLTLYVQYFVEQFHPFALLNKEPNVKECDAKAASFMYYCLLQKISTVYFITAAVSSDDTNVCNICFSKIVCTSGLQLPQPKPAPAAWHNPFNSV